MLTAFAATRCRIADVLVALPMPLSSPENTTQPISKEELRQQQVAARWSPESMRDMVQLANSMGLTKGEYVATATLQLRHSPALLSAVTGKVSSGDVVVIYVACELHDSAHTLRLKIDDHRWITFDPMQLKPLTSPHSSSDVGTLAPFSSPFVALVGTRVLREARVD